jgi:hypothetical protein
VVKPAVEEERVVRPPIAIRVAKPSGRMKVKGNLRPVIVSTRRPRPAEIRPRTSGKMIQETIRGPER